MREGILKFNEENNRYGLWDYEKEYWIDNGFHCGECLDVFVNGQWIHSRMEMGMQSQYYLVNTKFEKKLENIFCRI